MKKQLKKILTSNKFSNKVFQLFSLFRQVKIKKESGINKKYPSVIQLPITTKCNSRCVMCNIWKMKAENEFTVEEFAGFLKDDVFKNVISVGINGGEPSLLSNLPDYVSEVLKLPKIKNLNVISNGLAPQLLLPSLEKIYSQCKKMQVRFYISISLDGVGEVHDQVRGIPGAFSKTVKTIESIKSHQEKYCDGFEIACTVVKQNVDHLVELEEWASIKGLNIKYRLGIANQRIKSELNTQEYSVINSESMQSSKEFFYSMMVKSKKLLDKFRYFSIFYWLNNYPHKRLLGCAWRDRGITMDPQGNLYYCAVASKCLGSLRENKGTDIFFNDDNISYRQQLIYENCENCIHDYMGTVEFKNILIFLKFLLKLKFGMKIYKIKSRLL